MWLNDTTNGIIFIIRQWNIIKNLTLVHEKYFRRTFRYEFFVRTHPKCRIQNLMKIKISQNSKFSIFENGMSSYWDEFLSQKIMKWMYSKVFSIPIIIPHIFKTFEKKHKSHVFFSNKICEYKFSNIEKHSEKVLHMCHKVSDGTKWSYLLPNNLWHSGITFPYTPTNFSLTVGVFHFSCAFNIDMEFFGMSSYGPESSSIEKCGTWRIFWIPTMLSYLL